MISAIVATLNDERRLGATLAALVPAAVQGLVREVLIADAGSTDATAAIADDAGADLIADADAERAMALACAAARGSWLLILDAGARLRPGWEPTAEAHMRERPERAAWFARDGAGWLTKLRSPRFDRGLLLSKALYEARGGWKGGHAGLIRRLGRGRLCALAAKAGFEVR